VRREVITPSRQFPYAGHAISCRELQKKTLGEAHPSYATTLNNIGLTYDNQGKYEIALKYYEGREIP
jgi:hypothetical protein